MPNSEHIPENWFSWEIDPSTRTAVHPWNKYVPIDVTVGTTAVDLFSVARGEPSVNLVHNPSIENADITEFVASGATRSQSSAQAASGANSLLVNPDNEAAGEGVYWTHTFVGNTDGTAVIAQCEIRGASASGSVKLAIQDSSGTQLAATDAVDLSTSFQRLTLSHQLLERQQAEYRVAIVTAAQHNIDFYVDKIHVEVRKDGAVLPYVDGSLGINYEWYGTAHLSPSRRKAGISVVRGFKLTNGHGSNTVNIALDTTATAAGATSTGVLLKTASTWETPWPMDIRQNISAIASGSGTQVYGVVYGVHQG